MPATATTIQAKGGGMSLASTAAAPPTRPPMMETVCPPVWGCGPRGL